MKQFFKSTIALVTLSLVLYTSSIAQTEVNDLNKAISNIEKSFENYNHRLDVLQKKIDDIYWYNKVGDLAYIDKVYMTGPPLAKEKNPTAQGAGNPVKFWSYISKKPKPVTYISFTCFSAWRSTFEFKYLLHSYHKRTC